MLFSHPTYRLLPLLLLLAIAGCSETPTSVSSNPLVPLGRWSLVRTYQASGGSGPSQIRSRLDLTSQTTGRMRDSVFVEDAGGWSLVSVSDVTLQFESVGDGYLRTLEINREKGDTLLRYWYFFRRGGRLFYYRGMRFLGANAALAGSWSTDAADMEISGSRYFLSFADGHATWSVQGNNALPEETHPYVVSGDTIRFPGVAFAFGDRYEVFPGWSLYITNHVPEDGYSLLP